MLPALMTKAGHAYIPYRAPVRVRPSPQAVVAVVLAGGEGRRMGGAKPLRRLGQSTLIARAVELARSYSPIVAVAVRDPDQVGTLADVELLRDPPELEGPLAGLAAALAFGRRLDARQVLTLPCDAPRLPLDLRDRLAAAMQAGSLQMAMALSADRLHPTCALWSVACLSALEDYAGAGHRSLRGLASALRMDTVAWDGDGPDPFVNINTPADLAELEAALGQERAAA